MYYNEGYRKNQFQRIILFNSSKIQINKQKPIRQQNRLYFAILCSQAAEHIIYRGYQALQLLKIHLLQSILFRMRDSSNAI